jgi:ABC-type uncharacterized transport system ATPase subunit
VTATFRVAVTLLVKRAAAMMRQEHNRSGRILQEIAQDCLVLVAEHNMELASCHFIQDSHLLWRYNTDVLAL